MWKVGDVFMHQTIFDSTDEFEYTDVLSALGLSTAGSSTTSGTGTTRLPAGTSLPANRWSSVLGRDHITNHVITRSTQVMHAVTVKK